MKRMLGMLYPIITTSMLPVNTINLIPVMQHIICQATLTKNMEYTHLPTQLKKLWFICNYGAIVPFILLYAI